MADRFYATHNAGFTPYPYPKDLFLKFVKENNGYFPIKLEVHRPHPPFPLTPCRLSPKGLWPTSTPPYIRSRLRGSTLTWLPSLRP